MEINTLRRKWWTFYNLQTAVANYEAHDNCKLCTLWKECYLLNVESKKNRKAILDTDWNGWGKPRINDSTMTKIVNLHIETYKAFGKEYINKMIMKDHNEFFSKTGHIPLNLYDQINQNNKQFQYWNCNESEHVYHTNIYNQTNTWYAAKYSFQGSISYLFVIAVTHFILAFKEESDIRKELNSVFCLVRIESCLAEGTNSVYNIYWW